LPTEKPLTEAARQDWNHLTDFLHHKLLLVDGNRLQAGGRNVEDSYHMHPNPLAKKYIFMDTDISMELKGGGEGVTRAFDALWDFDAMVATLAEIRQHAPNDFVANLDAYRDSALRCRAELTLSRRKACVDQQFQARFKDLALRLADNTKRMELSARTYRQTYARKAFPRARPFRRKARQLSRWTARRCMRTWKICLWTNPFRPANDAGFTAPRWDRKPEAASIFTMSG